MHVPPQVPSQVPLPVPPQPSKGPSRFSRILIKADQVFSKIPGFSTLTGVINLVIKGILRATYKEPTQPTSHYFRYIMTKDAAHCAKLLVPGLNIYVSRMSPYEKGKQLEKMGDTLQAIEEYKKGAEKEGPDACHELYSIYREGRGVEKDENLAFGWLALAVAYGHQDAKTELKQVIQEAKSHNEENAGLLIDGFVDEAVRSSKEAQFTLGMFFREIEPGVGKVLGSRLRQGSDRLLKNAAYDHLKEAQYELGMISLKENRSTQGLEWLEKAAYNGLDKAQYEVGLQYVSQGSFDKAAKYFKLAANQGHALASSDLQWCLWLKGGAQEKEKASRWLTDAKEQGNTRAMYYLGRMQTLKNIPEGRKLLLAAAKEDNDARFFLGKNLLKGELLLGGEKKGDASVISQAIELLSDATKEGHLGAQYELGMHFLSEGQDDTTHAKGAALLQELADLGNPDARYHLGRYLLKKKDPTDIDRGIKLLGLEVQAGNQFAQYELGSYYLAQKDPATRMEGVKLLDQASHGSNKEVKIKAGLEAGRAVDESDFGYTWEKKVDLLKQAADAGSIEAHYELGLRRYNAESNFRTAAETNYVPAQYELGVVLLQKMDSEKNWYELAKKQLLENAPIRKDDIERFENAPEKINQLRKEGLAWFKKAAHSNFARAQYELGLRYLGERGIDADFKQAIFFLHQAADQKDAWAEYELGKCYLKGRVVNKDKEMGKNYITKAANDGNINAQYDLSKLEENTELGLAWLKKAAEARHPEAMYEVGKMLVDSGKYQDGVAMLEELVNKAAYLDVPLLRNVWYTLGTAYLDASSGSLRTKGVELLRRVSYLPEACEKLSDCYQKGTGVGVDLEEAARWLNEAKKLRSQQSS